MCTTHLQEPSIAVLWPSLGMPKCGAAHSSLRTLVQKKPVFLWAQSVQKLVQTSEKIMVLQAHMVKTAGLLVFFVDDFLLVVSHLRPQSHEVLAHHVVQVAAKSWNPYKTDIKFLNPLFWFVFIHTHYILISPQFFMIGFHGLDRGNGTIATPSRWMPRPCWRCLRPAPKMRWKTNWLATGSEINCEAHIAWVVPRHCAVRLSTVDSLILNRNGRSISIAYQSCGMLWPSM